MNILIRVDSSNHIGAGHVFRCRNLARQFKSEGCHVTFIMRQHPGNLISLISQEFLVLSLPVNQDYTLLHPSNHQESITNWLGASQELDASQSFQLVFNSDLKCVDLLVTDHYSISDPWEHFMLNSLESLYKFRPSLLVIDDLANRRHTYADILTDQNYLGINTSQRYDKLVGSSCRLLLGPEYALLSPDYHSQRKNIKPRNKLKSILIYLGGSDVHCLGEYIAECILSINQNYNVGLIVGPQSSISPKLTMLDKKFSHFHIYQGLDSLAPLIATSDFAFAAGGVNTWERATLGLPSCTIIVAENQRECSYNISSFVGASDLCHDRSISFQDINNIISIFESNPERLTNLSLMLMSICSGRGIYTITQSSLEILNSKKSL